MVRALIFIIVSQVLLLSCGREEVEPTPFRRLISSSPGRILALAMAPDQGSGVTVLAGTFARWGLQVIGLRRVLGSGQ